ncbi:MAG: hypothetical protein IPK70_09495 [Flavobacteriales bacterium]|jgi:hypothetical protein|nr:hypothetical protein [Flavobacteriales bacterium]
MGYMGFGMKKEAYSRPPRRHMAYLKPYLSKEKSKDEASTRRTGPWKRRFQEQPRALLPPRIAQVIAVTVALAVAGTLVALLVKFLIHILDPKNVMF